MTKIVSGINYNLLNPPKDFMDSSLGFIGEMQKKLDSDISHDELQIFFFAILFLIENRKTAQMTPFSKNEF